MGVISTDKRKISIYYHSGTSIGKQAYAYTHASEKKLLGIDISKTNVTGTQWAELADGLGLKISELIQTDHPDFKQKYGNNTPDMEPHDWLKILEKEPQLLKFPIVIFGEKYIQIKSASDFKKYIEADSAGLDKKTIDKQFTDEH